MLTLSARVRVECHHSYTTIVTPFEIAFNVDSAYPTTMYFLQQIVRPKQTLRVPPAPRGWYPPAGLSLQLRAPLRVVCVCLHLSHADRPV